MSDELAAQYERLRFIELRGDGSKLPAKEWGGYSQDFDEAELVYDADDIDIHPNEEWGVVDIEDPPHGSMSLLIFDVDIHKAPDDFDADRLRVPTNTLVTRSQNGGFHVYFAVNGYDAGDLSESDFPVVADIPFDIDIRGSAVSHHVVAPSDFPGCGGDYEIVNDAQIRATFDPAEAGESLSVDGEDLLAYEPGSDIKAADYDWDLPGEAPDEMPTCYFRGLELRKDCPDDHPNTHKVNLLAALCGLGAGYDAETVIEHMTTHWAPWDGESYADEDTTEYQVNHIAQSMERGGYSPPAESTLREFGLLKAGEHCEDCPIDFHGPRQSSPELDVVAESESKDEREPSAEAEAVAGAETDGGVQADDGDEPSRSFADSVQAVLMALEDGDIQEQTARHRIASQLVQRYSFTAPEREVRGWRETLYVFNDDEGIYEPRGEAFVEKTLERVAGDFITNQARNEIVDKVRRLSIQRGERFNEDPHRLVVGNGILDLHTGEKEPYTPAEYHRTKIDVDWNPDAGEPDAIDEFLHEIVDDSDVASLYRLIAHSLYKEYVGEKAAMLVGSGQNGKSVFLDFVEQFLGSPNVSHRSLQAFEDDFKANQLEGKLANIHPDMGDRAVKDLSTFKKLTGRDTMLADIKFESPIEFENHATLMFAANEMPAFDEDNHAVWRRWVYVDFPYTFDDYDQDAKDPEPKRQIMCRLTTDEQLEALLLRCQQEIQEWYGGREWYADAMEPDDVREKMKKASEPVFAFASSCLEPGDGEDDYVQKRRVRECYNAFADAEDLPRIPENEFGGRLMALRDYTIEPSQKRVDGSRIHVYDNIRLTSRGRQLLDLDDDTDDEQQGVGDEYSSPKPKVLERVSDMVDENNGQPVPTESVVWSLASEVGRTTAQQTIERLLERGSLMEPSEGRVIDT